MKIQVSAPANIAFLKYWGAKDLSRAVPQNTSFSMTLDRARAVTTLEFEEGSDAPDVVHLVDDAGQRMPVQESFSARVVAHLERLKTRHRRTGRFRIATRNTFPMSAGLASSAAGFAALAYGAAQCFGLDADERELSVMARLSGSGSASRSLAGGYVLWPSPPDNPEAPAEAVFSQDHWGLRDLIALVETGPKLVSSLEGHQRADTSPHFATRQRTLAGRLDQMVAAVKSRDFDKLAIPLEEEAIELHLIAMSSRPPVFYWNPATLTVLEAVRELRSQGISAASTMDAGANVHVICTPDAEQAVLNCLRSLPGVRDVLQDQVGPGPRVETDANR